MGKNGKNDKQKKFSKKEQNRIRRRRGCCGISSGKARHQAEAKAREALARLKSS